MVICSKDYRWKYTLQWGTMILPLLSWDRLAFALSEIFFIHQISSVEMTIVIIPFNILNMSSLVLDPKSFQATCDLFTLSLWLRRQFFHFLLQVSFWPMANSKFLNSLEKVSYIPFLGYDQKLSLPFKWNKKWCTLIDLKSFAYEGHSLTFPLQICICARLCTSLVMGAYSYSLEPENSYLLVTAAYGWELLEDLRREPEEEVLMKWKSMAEEFKQTVKWILMFKFFF